LKDLPRFHQGRLGPLDFQTLNDVMRRLDVLRPVLDSLGQKSDPDMPPVDPFILVYAKPADPPFPGRFDWRQVLIRGSSTATIPTVLDPDTIVNEDDEDFEDITDAASFKSGRVWIDDTADPPVEDTTYAISVDPGFEEGYAACYVTRRTDGQRSFLLFPIQASQPADAIQTTSLVRIRSVGQQVIIPGANGELIRAQAYSCQRIKLKKGLTEYETSSSSYTLLDFGQNPATLNKPSIVPSGPVLTPRTLDIDSIVLAAFDPSSERFVASTLTHFDVTCS